MAGTATIREGATTGYIVDAPEIRALIEKTEQLASTVTNDAGCAQRQQFDFEAQTVRPFRPGWSNLPGDNPAAS